MAQVPPKDPDAPTLPAEPAADATLPEGAMLDHRLQILRPIGSGGMGMVYAARHVGLCKDVAVKVLSARHARGSEVALRLQQEARHASSIRDPHIVEIFDIGETADGRAFIVMELLAGESLAQRLKQKGWLAEAEVWRIGRQVALGLCAAHRAGIVHRDVKPENIFLCAREDEAGERVKLLDFGLAKALQAQEASLHLTQSGMLMGTPLYMSPEQARGAEDLDHRVDIYALGVVLYECLTGEVPFRAKNYLGVLSQIQTETPLAPRQRRPDLGLSASGEALVLRAMARERNARYPDAAALIADLDVVIGGGVPSGGAGSEERPPGPRLWPWLLSGALLLLLPILRLLGGNESPPPAAATAPDQAAGEPDLGTGADLRAAAPDLCAPPDLSRAPDLRPARRGIIRRPSPPRPPDDPELLPQQ